MADAQLKPGWLRRDVLSATRLVARDELAAAELRVRQINDELSDACSAVKAAKAKVRRLDQKS